VTSGASVLELRVLGPLEARLEGGPIQLGGAKQRSVLAVLLLRAGEVVPVQRLVDELWPDEPPVSATHTLEVYVSRLRQLFNGYGPSLVRRGGGYVLDLGTAKLDSRDFEELAQAVSEAAASGDHRLVAALAKDALAVWRGVPLADVALGPCARSEVERLEEAALRVHELRIDAELALGRHEAVVGELRMLVAESPYRERFVVQLMLALYESGRHAEALDAYERFRRRLDEDLGLQPSVELQQLSARIVRQEVGRGAARPSANLPTSGPRRARRLSGLVLACAAVAAVATLGAAGSARQLDAAEDSTRIALVVQSDDSSAAVASRNRELTDALYDVSARTDLEPQVVSLGFDPRSPEVGRLVGRLLAERVDLVLLAVAAPTARTFAPYLSRLPATRAVFLDASVDDLGLRGVENAVAVRYAVEQPSQLAGALSGLARPRSGAERRPEIVSVVAERSTRDTRRAIAAFEHGFELARPGHRVLVSYTHEHVDPTACERIANEQIDAGSDVVFVHSGPCGRGALAVAKARGVWAISGDGVAPPA
jgi:DNA-binding SARP family transcriptional activator/basic membrane lipoprotein Med (substrate-binding protein (PBP1-ABC) superfamily)